MDGDRLRARDGARSRIVSGARFRAAQSIVSSVGSARVPRPSRSARTAEFTMTWSARSSRSRPTSSMAARPARWLPSPKRRRDFACRTASTSKICTRPKPSAPGSDERTRWPDAIEREVLPGAAFVTAGSPMIAAAYAEKLGCRSTDSQHFLARIRRRAAGGASLFALYWMSQTLGRGPRSRGCRRGRSAASASRRSCTSARA